MGLITDLYGSDWKNIDSEVNQDFIDSVRAALGGPELSGDLPFPPSIGGCVDIGFDGLLEASASPELAAAFDIGLDTEDKAFERVFVEGLYDMTLEIIDKIPMGPMPPPIPPDPSSAVDLSYFPNVGCLELPEFMACFVEFFLTADDCVCDYLPLEPTEEQQALMEEQGYDNFCDFFIKFVLPSFFPIDIPWPPSFSLPFEFPPDWCALFFPPEIECDFDLPDISFLFVFEWAINWVIDFAFSLPTIAIDLSACIISAGFDPCEIVTCVVDTIVELMAIDDLLAAINLPVSFIAAIAVYVQKVSIHLVQMVLGFIFGVGLITDCIGEALGLG